MTFAIEAENPLIPLWPLLRVDVLAVLKERSYRWCALDVLRRRRTVEPTDEDDTTIMVTGQWVDKKQQQEAESLIREKCIAHGLPNLRVEIVEGKIWR